MSSVIPVGGSPTSTGGSPVPPVGIETKMKLAQTTLSKLRRSDLFAENRSAQAAQLRRSGIFNFVSRAEVAPTELENFLDAVATKIPRLRRWEMPQANLRASAQGEGSTGHWPVPSGDSPDGTGWTSAKPGALDSSNGLGHSGRRVADRHGRVARATHGN